MPSAKSRQAVDTIIGEPQLARVRQFDGFFSTLRLFGLTERPSIIIGDRVSRLFRLYSFLLSAAAVGFAGKNVASLFYPGLESIPMLLGVANTTQRAVYPTWCVMCAAIRVFVSYITLSGKFGRALRNNFAEVFSDGRLTERFVLMNRSAFFFNLFNGTVINLMVSSSMSMYHKFHKEPLLTQVQDPRYHLFLLESTVLASAWVGSFNIMAVIGRGLLRGLFSTVSEDIVRFSRSKDVDGLQAAMDRHSICCRLTTTFNSVFQIVIGLTFTTTVPVFSVVTTQVIIMAVDGLTSQIDILSYLLLWSGCCILFTTLACINSTIVQEAATAPLRPLLEAPVGDNVPSYRFIQRLTSCPIGFSYFNFFVVQRTTILSVFSLMVTYLIVFLQMAQANSSLPSAAQLGFGNRTNTTNMPITH